MRLVFRGAVPAACCLWHVAPHRLRAVFSRATQTARCANDAAHLAVRAKAAQAARDKEPEIELTDAQKEKIAAEFMQKQVTATWGCIGPCRAILYHVGAIFRAEVTHKQVRSYSATQPPIQ